MNRSEAIDRALQAGATITEIESETALQSRHVGTTPFRCMIKALHMHSWHNTKSDWIRLAAALSAQSLYKRNR